MGSDGKLCLSDHVVCSNSRARDDSPTVSPSCKASPNGTMNSSNVPAPIRVHPSTPCCSTNQAPAAPTDGVLSDDQQYIQHLKAQLRQTQSMAALGELTSTATHEFNNVLMTILNYAPTGDSQSR